MVDEHLIILEREIEIKKWFVFENERELSNMIAFELSGKEFGNISELITAKYIVTLELLTKDHKKPNNKLEWTTMLAIPATEFSATFAKIYYLGLKLILDNNIAKYLKYTTTQELQVRKIWYKLKCKK